MFDEEYKEPFHFLRPSHQFNGVIYSFLNKIENLTGRDL